jgi:hypothetical protein
VFWCMLSLCLIAKIMTAQTKISPDSIIARTILKNNNIDLENNSVLNDAEYQLDLSKSQVKKIAKVLLRKVLGRCMMIKQRPFHYIKYKSYWIIIGKTYKNPRKGTFILVVNSRNGCVEHLSLTR